jgi:hypothetical protein
MVVMTDHVVEAFVKGPAVSALLVAAAMILRQIYSPDFHYYSSMSILPNSVSESICADT